MISKQYDQKYVGSLKEIPTNIIILVVKVDKNGEILDNYTQYGWTKDELVLLLGIQSFKGVEFYDLIEVQLRLIPLYPGEELDKKMEIKFQALLTFSPDPAQLCPQVILVKNYKQFIDDEKGFDVKYSEYYVNPKVIGNGAYGAVSKVREKKTGLWYAMKVVNLEKLDDDSKSAKDKIQKEILIQKKIDSPFVIKIKEHFLTGNAAFIVMELGKQDLQSVVKERKRENKYFSQMELSKMMFQISKAVQATHKCGVMHRDLKPGNIMLCDDGNYKLIDFGFARDSVEASSLLGTELYIAPEIVVSQVNANQIQEKIKYSNSVDIFSLGCILYYLITFENAFQSNGDVLKNNPLSIKVGKYDSDICDMCFKMLSKDPKQRPSIDEVVQLFEDLTQLPEIKYEPIPIKSKAGFEKLISDSKIILKHFQPLIDGLAIRAENENKVKPIEKYVNPSIFKEICEIKIQCLIYFGNGIKVIKSEIKFLFNNFSFANLFDGIHYGEINTNRQIQFQKIVCNNKHQTQFEGTELFGPLNKDGLNGYCKIKYKSGSKYCGECKRDKRDGFGVQQYANGDVYEGDWIDDELSGKGVFKYANGRIDEGEYKNGLLNGYAIIKYENGDVYEGNCKDDKNDGQGKFVKKNGKVLEGIWKYVEGKNRFELELSDYETEQNEEEMEEGD